ncbi:MAG TPA: hypothetical protein QGF58_26115 [Myxococcota bacterium]|nr:hypothetical protein [Myxococcota bacterium]
MFIWLCACIGSEDDSTVESGGEDSTPVEHDIVYPTQNKVLFYDGHGGEPGESSGRGDSDDMEDWIGEHYGFAVEARDTLGTPSKFRAVFLMDPGSREPYSWQEDDVALLTDAMEAGTRIIVLVDVGNCVGSTVNPLLEQLGASARLVGDNSETTEIIPATAGSQITEGVGDVYLQEPCIVEVNGTTPLFTSSRYTYGTAERPAWGGDVVVIGDFSFIDDTGKYDNGDNLTLIGNLVEVDPDF